MRFTMKGPLRDLVAFGRHLNERRRIFAGAIAEPLPQGRMNALAKRLHPRRQELTVADSFEEYPGCLTYRLEPSDTSKGVASFRAGQYIAVESSVAGNRVNRPFSIASTPDEARAENAYIITLKLVHDGYVAGTETHEWCVGTNLVCSEPEGQFFYEPLRDADTLVCLAGGTGITPFRSIVTDALRHETNTRVVLIHGVNEASHAIYRRHFEALAAEYRDRFTYSVVLATESFITGEIIEMAIGSNASISDVSFFICGPEAMQVSLADELERFALPRRRVRRENFGTTDTGGGLLYRAGMRGDGEAGSEPATVSTASDNDSPRRTAREPTIVVHCPHGGEAAEGTPGGNNDRSVTSISDDPVGATTIPARRDETILVAMERAGLNPPARCRSGECGWCRSKLVAGTVRIRERSDRRRGADRTFSYIHPCAAYPVTDAEIRLIRNPLGGTQHETGD